LNKVPCFFQGSVVSLITCAVDESKNTHCECGNVVLESACCGNASSLERDATIYFLIIHLFQSLQFNEMWFDFNKRV